METDTEAQMVASILSKKKTAGATHVLIDIPVGPSAKIRSHAAAERLAELFRSVAHRIDLQVDVIITEVRGPIGWGIGPRLEALDVLAVLRRDPDAPSDLREKSLYLAARILEMTGSVGPAGGYRAAQQALDSGAAEQAFSRIVVAQGVRGLPGRSAVSIHGSRAGRWAYPRNRLLGDRAGSKTRWSTGKYSGGGAFTSHYRRCCFQGGAAL